MECYCQQCGKNCFNCANGNHSDDIDKQHYVGTPGILDAPTSYGEMVEKREKAMRNR